MDKQTLEKVKKLTGATLAAAVALTFSSATFSASAEEIHYKWVKCYGVNSCKGMSPGMLTTNQCSAIHNCKGQNACKGRGWAWKTPENCKAAGGSAPETPERMK